MKSISEQVKHLDPMPWSKMVSCPGPIVKQVQEWADQDHHFKIKDRLGIPAEEPLPEWWLRVWTMDGMHVAKDLTALDVPIPRLFTAAVLTWKMKGRQP